MKAITVPKVEDQGGLGISGLGEPLSHSYNIGDPSNISLPKFV